MDSEQDIAPPSPEQIAYHEAGHAVVARACHLPVKRVQIIAEAKHNALGSCIVGEANNPSWTHAHIAHCWAGVLAERRLCNERGWSTDQLLMGAWGDIQGASAFVAMASGGDERVEEIYEMEGRWLASEALAVYWPVVQELAALLLERQNIPGREAQKFIDAGLARYKMEWKQHTETFSQRIINAVQPLYQRQQEAIISIQQRRQTAKQRALLATYQGIIRALEAIINYEGIPWFGLMMLETQRVVGDTLQTRRACTEILTEATYSLRAIVESEAIA